MRETPAQKQVKTEISSMSKQLSVMIQVRSSGLSLQDPTAIKKTKKDIEKK